MGAAASKLRGFNTIITVMCSCTPPFPFLRLPRELRYQIYDYLCSAEPLSYPFRTPPITSINQTPPPTDLQVTCRYLYEEIHAYFYGKATFRFVAQDILRVQLRNINPASLYAIRHARKVDLRLQWNITGQRAKGSSSTWPHSMDGWLVEQINLLLVLGESLEVIIVSVSDASENMDWESKSIMLAPLRMAMGRVEFRVGEVTAADEEEDELRERLGAYVKKLNKAAV